MQQQDQMITLLQKHLSQKTTLKDKNEQASQTVAQEAPLWLLKIKQQNAATKQRVRFVIPPKQEHNLVPKSMSFWDTLISLPGKLVAFFFPQEEDLHETAGLFDILGDYMRRYVRLEKMFALVLFFCEVLRLPALKKFALLVQHSLSRFFSWLHVLILLFDPSFYKSSNNNTTAMMPNYPATTSDMFGSTNYQPGSLF